MVVRTPDQDNVEAGVLVQQRRPEDHFGRLDSPYAELVQYVASIHERKDIIGRVPSEFGPQVGVDVAHHEVDLLLGVWIHGHPLGDHAADELMVVLAGSLLLALSGVAVEDLAEYLARARVHLDRKRVGELSSVVSEEHREIASESGTANGTVNDTIEYNGPAEPVCRFMLSQSKQRNDKVSESRREISRVYEEVNQSSILFRQGSLLCMKSAICIDLL